MTKTEQKEIAKNIMMSQIAIAHYQIDDLELYMDRRVKADDLTEKNLNAIYKYIKEYGEKMAEAIGLEFYQV